MGEAALVCGVCQAVYAIDIPIWRCNCGGLLNIIHEGLFDPKEIVASDVSLWRYRERLAIPETAIVTFGEGFTPLLPVSIGGREVLVKQEHLFQTGSYKDRGATTLISQAKALGVTRVVEDSSGNAGCAIAAYCAKAGISSDIYVPADTSPAKITQIIRYGAKIHAIPGSREDTAAAVMAAAQVDYYASHSWNPFFFEGTKTFSYEVWEQMNGHEPAAVVLPAGNGTILLGAYLGFQDLLASGLIRQMPRMIGVQASACNPLAQALNLNSDEPVAIAKQDTIAEGIAIAAPIRGKQIIEAVRKTGGFFISVSEQEIVESLDEMCRAGYYIEPTSAATIAGVKRIVQSNLVQGTIVSLFTGHGLKANDKMMKIHS